jgi:5-formyltetrahydrofolate cyclo-ligase
MTKSELRKLYLSKRQALSEPERQRLSGDIAELLFESFDFDSVKVLHCYIPIEKFKEVNTRPLFERIWDKFREIVTVVPKVNHVSGEMENVTYDSESILTQNRWEIQEPVHDRRVEPESIDMVLAPLVCFDRRGHRVGYGKGFYDRFLRRCRSDCLKIGLNFFSPVEEISDAHDGDVRLDFAVTPDGIYTIAK